ncbi:MAG: formate dehydrogenase accessory sulfurtransferase FdhD [Spirochaetes bacterium]|nr:formate dehydrogenase accessory sulfurtransferase FdhD [Spirochaetota bacterium]
MEAVKQIKVLRVKDGVAAESAESVILEHRLFIDVNGQRKADLIVLPQNLEELAIGHLYCSGIIRSIDDIAEMSVDAKLKTVSIKTSFSPNAGDDGDSEPGGFFCQCFQYFRVSCALSPDPIPDGPVFPLAGILSAMELFLKKSEVFANTGAVHSCAILADNQFLHFMEDIGRHNALDKTIGAALKAGTPLDRSVVLTSGRLPSDMMSKVVYSRVPVVVSRAAPTSASLELAERCNVTLCGFARENRINIYTGRERLAHDG